MPNKPCRMKKISANSYWCRGGRAGDRIARNAAAEPIELAGQPFLVAFAEKIDLREMVTRMATGPVKSKITVEAASRERPFYAVVKEPAALESALAHVVATQTDYWRDALRAAGVKQE